MAVTVVTGHLRGLGANSWDFIFPKLKGAQKSPHGQPRTFIELNFSCQFKNRSSENSQAPKNDRSDKQWS